jgi:hypothetical protein
MTIARARALVLRRSLCSRKGLEHQRDEECARKHDEEEDEVQSARQREVALFSSVKSMTGSLRVNSQMTPHEVRRLP